MKKLGLILFILFFFGTTSIFFAGIVHSAELCDQWTGKIIKVQGEVLVKRSEKREFETGRRHEILCPGDMIQVSRRSRATILFPNETFAHLDQNTTLIFTAPEKEEFSLIELLKGALNLISRTPRTLEVITPFMNAGVEGTEFLVRVKDNMTTLTVFEGQVKATNNAGTLFLDSGQSAIAMAGKAPEQKVVVRPRDGVQWALYYPPVLYFSELDFPDSSSGWQGALRNSSGHFRAGNLSEAFSSIDNVPDRIPDPRFYTYRASLLLSVGRIAEAQDDLTQALSIETDNSNALALQSIIAVVQNEKDRAISFAHEAAEADPGSATAQIALSYAHQANFNLDAALASIRKAIELQPENGLAWARLAELQLSFGDVDKAFESAQTATEKSPNLARTQTVLGYSYLTKVDTHRSMVHFERAIMLDQADPLPRLGMGLAKIRNGRLKDGRQEIEGAASLDPGNSLVRSYLGKSYYEEKRDSLAQDQYAIAQELDPLDPTPFFYNAIRKQTINRPVDALQDMERAIELNDNRAIYRSKQLLDDDLAARSAGLARVYSDLGFEQLALVEGWKSVNTDPGNYSAHRFLADTYSTLPRHEIARVSELLQSQLMQPLNITPVQPSLAESNLFILDGAGPGNPSFNEFNPLFNRNRVALQASGVIGENNTWGNEIVVSGVQDRFAISAGQFHYETEGFRENNDLEQDIYNVFTQISLNHKTSVQAEYRHKEVEQGDLQVRFDQESFSSLLREEERLDSLRAGFHHALSRSSDILVSAIYSDNEIEEPPFYINDQTGFAAEAQHLYRCDLINLVSGVGYFTSEEKEKVDDEDGLFKSEIDTDHTNVYLYAHVKYPRQVVLTLGVSGDSYKRDSLDLDEDQFNPKLGLTWSPRPGTTVRAAAFRTFKRTLQNNQTLEPTQVAGFNQFFDEPNGTDAWRYGAGLDQKIGEDLYSGVEFSMRELEFMGRKFGSIEEIDRDEYLGRAYVYWTPHSWVAIRTEYQYEKFKWPDDFIPSDFVSKAKTHRVSPAVNISHPSGITFEIKPEYIVQDGEFISFTQFGPMIGDDSDRFWIFNASIGYRLPKRYGIITLEGRNLFDEEYRFVDTDPGNPRLYPERLILGKFTLSF